MVQKTARAPMKPTQIEDAEQLCRALVQIPSENHSGAPESKGEAAIAQFVADFLTDRGATVQFESIAPGRANVYGWFPTAANSQYRILFAPHLDTVPARGMTIDPFSAQSHDGRIYGRGASDTKGPMAAMLWALATVDLSQLNATIGFAGLADEEADQIGAKICAKSVEADLVIVAEPTDLTIVYTHKGTAWTEWEACGRSAHAAMPETGTNAIELLMKAYTDLKRAFPQLCAAPENSLLGPPTISLGTIHAGTKINVVPDRCVAEVDIRTIPGQEKMVTAVQDFLRDRHPAITVRPLKVSNPMYTDPSHPLIQKLAAHGASLAGASWFCDAANFADQGIPAVALGPGSMKQAHTSDEFIELAELERGVQFFRNFLLSFRQ
jgi:acetylornithine deacetylase/succinyl-diaminopimelate desuccinylase family protein